MPKEKKIKYDYSNPESQKLFEEFTVLLGEITGYIEEVESSKLELEKRLGESTKLKYILKRIVCKFNRLIGLIIRFFSRTIKSIFRR